MRFILFAFLAHWEDSQTYASNVSLAIFYYLGIFPPTRVALWCWMQNGKLCRFLRESPFSIAFHATKGSLLTTSQASIYVWREDPLSLSCFHKSTTPTCEFYVSPSRATRIHKAFSIHSTQPYRSPYQPCTKFCEFHPPFLHFAPASLTFS